ncbi:MAG: ligand-gated channel protein [bacterium]|nr:ligand-gated channel protein [bacterium]
MRKLCGALGAACLVLALSSSAAADDRTTARDHFLKGTKYFDLGHFDEAIKEYEAAYEIKDEPVLLYNIAQAHRLAGHSKEAVHFYRSYLRRVPKATNRDEVETKIAEISKLIEQQEKTRTLPPDLPMSPGEQRAAATKPRPTETPKPQPIASPPPPVTTPTEPPPVATTTPAEQPPVATAPEQPPPPAVEPKPSSPGFFGGPGKVKKIVGIALLGVGVAGLAVGGAMSALAVGASNDVQAEANAGQPFDPAKESAGKTDQVVGGVMYGVGAAAVVAGGVMLYLGVREDKKASTHAMLVVPVLSPTQAGAAFQIRF